MIETPWVRKHREILDAHYAMTGPTFPTSPPDGMMFCHEVTGRKILYCYDLDNTTWVPIISIGTMDVYVDKTDGSDSLEDHGHAVNGDAFETIAFAFSVIPGLYGGNVIIHLNEESYAENFSMKGKAPTGAYTITITAALNTVETEVGATVVDGDGRAHGTIAGTLGGDYSDKLAYLVTDGVYRVIDSNAFTLGYDAGENVPVAGDIITGDTSNAVATVISWTEVGGAWATNDQTGVLTLHVTAGTFQNDENLTNETQSNTLADVDTGGGNAANNNIVILCGTAGSSTGQDVIFYDWTTILSGNIVISPDQKNIVFENIEFQGYVFPQLHAKAFLRQCTFTGAGGYMYLDGGGLLVSRCAVVGTPAESVRSQYYGDAYIVGSKVLNSVAGASCLRALGGKIYIAQGTVLDGSAIAGVNMGLEGDTNGMIVTYSADGSGLNKIRNFAKGIYVDTGTQVKYTADIAFSGNTTDKDADAASFGKID